MILRLGFIAWLAALVLPSCAIDPVTTLECHRRQYSYKVQQADSEGRVCWDHIHVMSCWGRCDSNEIADWKFPYKKSHHPVCLHSATQSKTVMLRNCDTDTAPGTEVYTFQEAASCACSICRSSEASCEGLRYRGARRAPHRAKRIRQTKRRETSFNQKVSHNPRIGNFGIVQSLNLIKAFETANDLQKITQKDFSSNIQDTNLKCTRKRQQHSVFRGQIPLLDALPSRNDHISFEDFTSSKREVPASLARQSPAPRPRGDTTTTHLLNLHVNDVDF